MAVPFIEEECYICDSSLYYADLSGYYYTTGLTVSYENVLLDSHLTRTSTLESVIYVSINLDSEINTTLALISEIENALSLNSDIVMTIDLESTVDI